MPIHNAYLAYWRYQRLAEFALVRAEETRAVVWGYLYSASYSLSLTESVAYPPEAPRCDVPECAACAKLIPVC